MLEKIVDLSLRYRVLVLVGLALIIGLGVRAWRQVPVDAFPDVTPVQVSVLVESPGLAPEDVEKLLTFPVESSLAGLPGVKTVRSISLFGLSTVTVYFDDNVDIYFARRLVAERLVQVQARIPAGFGEAEMGPNSSGLGQVFWYTVEAADQRLSQMDLRTLQDWTIRMQLRTVPGVEEVTSWGGQQKQFQVLVDPNKLVKYGLTFKTVMDALLANNRQVGGQYVDIGPEQFLVRGTGRANGLDEIAAIPLLSEHGTAVHVRDVAQVQVGGSLRFGAATRDGKEVVFGMALQRIGANAREVASAVKAKLDQVQEALPEGVKINPVYDRTSLVDKAVKTATSALLEGSVLVAVVLFLFLGEIRSALVVVATLPLAMLIAFLLMQQVGLSANLMSLAGLAVAIGMMIDGAVVLVENVYRRLNQPESARQSRVDTVRQGSFEVVQPVAFAILVIVVVFLPLFSLGDIEGKMFRPMALSITFAMVGSLLLTLTVVPVLGSLILKPKGEHDTWLLRWAKRIYTPVLDTSLKHKGRVVAAALVALALSLAVVPFLGREFLPVLQEGAFMVRITSIASTSLHTSVEVAKKVEVALRAIPQVQTTLGLGGRAERGEPEDVNRTEMLVDLTDRSKWPQSTSYETLSRTIQEAAEKAAPTAVVSVGQPIQSRIDELVSGVRSPLALRIYGDDLGELDRLAAQIKTVLATISGIVDLSLEANKGKPQITVAVDRAAAARYGISVDQVLEVVQTGIGGEAAGVVLDGTRRFDIQVRLQPEFRGNMEAIRNLPVRAGDGALLPLARVAQVSTAEGYAFIRHDGLQRNAVVQLDVQGRDVNGFVTEARAAIARQVKLPPGYTLEWGGSFENQQRAMQRLAIIVPLTIGLIFVLLYTAFNSVTLAALIIANVPFAMVGGVLALLLSRQYLSVPSAIGFIAVFGVAMLNGIVLVSFINDQLAQGKTVREAVRDGALLRLRPVLMTASVAILGLVPMLVSHGVGAEIQRPLATVVVGGLLSSTLLTLVLLPLMFEWVHLFQARRRAKSQEKPSCSNDAAS